MLAKYCKGKGVDLGCGATKVHKDAIGIDLFQYPNNEVDYVGISADDLWMFKDSELDYIMASHLLEHMLDTKKTLKEWDRVLKRGGILGIIVPDAELRPKTILEDGHKTSFTKDVMSCLLKRYLGYKPLEHRNMIELEKPRNQKSILCVYQKI